MEGPSVEKVAVPEDEATTSPIPDRMAEERPLEGRVAIITGGAGGIGAAIAAHLAGLGARVAISYATSATAATSLAATLNGVAIKADVTSAASVASLFDLAEQAFSRKAHILVCCAGTINADYTTVSETSERSFEELFEVNAKGAFLCCREGARRLDGEGGRGRIVVVTSSMVAQGKAGFGVYAAAKAAAEAVVGVVAKEVGGKGVTANCVAPGPTATEMLYKVRKTKEEVARVAGECPMGRVGRPGDVAEVVGFLVGDGARWVNGQVIRANGGIV
ncbi:NADPH-dependent aldehyde reductase-like protein, chloroplastic isoform X2 [Wolffia australiana]